MTGSLCENHCVLDADRSYVLNICFEQRSAAIYSCVRQRSAAIRYIDSLAC